MLGLDPYNGKKTVPGLTTNDREQRHTMPLKGEMPKKRRKNNYARDDQQSSGSEGNIDYEIDYVLGSSERKRSGSRGNQGIEEEDLDAIIRKIEREFISNRTKKKK